MSKRRIRRKRRARVKILPLILVGDAIKWMCPLDNDYTYGEIIALRKSVATVKGTGLYSGITAEVHLRYIEKLMRGGGSVGSDCKKCSKRSITKAEL